MKIGKAAYAEVSNKMPSILYASKYTALSVIPSKIPAVEVPGIENRRPEVYSRATVKRIEDAGLMNAQF